MKTIVLLIIAFTGLTMETAVANKVYTKPLYVVEYRVAGTGAEIKVNDIPAIYHTAPGQTSSEKQVPEHIVNGENTISIRAFPLEEDNEQYRQDAYIEVYLSVREENESSNSNKPLIHIKLNPSNKKENLLAGTNKELGKQVKLLKYSEKEVVVQRLNTFASYLPEWEWQSGIIIENTKDNYNALLQKYREIYNYLKDGNKSELFKMYNSAAVEFAKAYHLSSKESGHRLMSTGEYMGNPDWELGDFEKFITQMDYRLETYANGKMARIVDNDNDSPLVYMEKSSRLLSFLKFSFYKNNNGEWIMIR